MNLLDLVLTKSIDPNATTEALRAALGLHADIARKVAMDPDEQIAFVSEADLEVLTGLDPRTVERLRPEIETLGLTRVYPGVRGRYASAWVLDEPAEAAVIDHNLGESRPVLARVLAPGHERWSRRQAGSAAWRVCAALAAVYGAEEAQIDVERIAALVGRSAANVRIALNHLGDLGLVVRRGRTRRWNAALLRPGTIEWEHTLDERRTDRATARRASRAVRREEWEIRTTARDVWRGFLLDDETTTVEPAVAAETSGRVIEEPGWALRALQGRAQHLHPISAPAERRGA